jgi:hypothetical protein
LGSITFFTASATDGVALASVPDGWSAGFWQPMASKHKQTDETTARAIRTFIRSSEGLDISFSKDTPIGDEVNFTPQNREGILPERKRLAATVFQECLPHEKRRSPEK